MSILCRKLQVDINTNIYKTSYDNILWEGGGLFKKLLLGQSLTSKIHVYVELLIISKQLPPGG